MANKSENVVLLNKITTKIGDQGKSFANCGMLNKSDPWFELVGNLDELNAILGLVQLNTLSHPILTQIQHTLFDIGADLYTNKINKFNTKLTTQLEKVMEDLQINQQPLTSFVLPFGSKCYLHLARAIARRTERSFWKLYDHDLQDSKVDSANKFDVIGVYLNRLSDLLFVLARNEQEKLWIPGCVREDL